MSLIKQLTYSDLYSEMRLGYSIQQREFAIEIVIFKNKKSRENHFFLSS